MNSITVENINKWLSEEYDENTHQEILRLQEENPQELEDAFYKTLKFGTGGLRGIMGVGTNRMNKYTVGSATQGFALYLKKCFPNEVIKVVVSYDSRNNSRYFAEITADIFTANKIHCFLFDELYLLTLEEERLHLYLATFVNDYRSNLEDSLWMEIILRISN